MLLFYFIITKFLNDDLINGSVLESTFESDLSPLFTVRVAALRAFTCKMNSTAGSVVTYWQHCKPY